MTALERGSRHAFLATEKLSVERITEIYNISCIINNIIQVSNELRSQAGLSKALTGP